MNRAELAALDLPTLTRQADAALRAASERHGLPPVRASGLNRAQMVQIIVTASIRAASEALTARGV